MKTKYVLSVITLVFTLLFCSSLQAQTFGASASAIWISDCTQDNFFNTTGSIDPGGNVFNNTNFGSHTQNSGTLVLRGGEVRTFKTPGVANVCSVRMYYRIYPQSGAPGSFNSIDLPWVDDCNVPSSQFPSGGSCVAGDQKWSRVTPDGTTTPYAPVDLTAFTPGNYILEVYYDVSGSSTTTTQCDETVTLNNGGANYKATFSVQAPIISTSVNPITCQGSDGSITISGLTPGATYSISYTDDGNPVGPNNFVANGSGQIIISGLKAGFYSDFELIINGCTTDLNTAIRLSDPIITPKFNKINPFCAGTTAPTLPTTSLNGITGTWNPAVIDNQTSKSYTFTPNGGQCGISVTINVTVTPRTVPSFGFGTSLIICAGGTVPALPATSTNGIAGTWSPSVVDNQHSGTYTFTPSGGQCATNATFTVTVNPNITPSFSFGTALTMCAGTAAPALPTTSGNGITGTWNPATVDNQNSATYTFTPTAGQCATTTTFNVTVNPNVTPVFGFGTSLTVCAGAGVPSLPSTSNNGITGTWNPSIVDNQNSATYTFTPSAGLCAPPVTFTVNITPNITPAFGIGTSLTICAGSTVPSLPTTSSNGVTGTWNPSTIDNQNSATYTFTPAAGQCALSTTFTVTVNPNLTPAFSFGTTLSTCAGASVPSLPATSNNGITGTWNPVAIDNQNSATYTFTPSPGQCAVPTSLTVTVNPNTTPVFSIGSSLTICAGSSVPSLPATSDNGVVGTWSPATIDNQHSATYTFTPSGGQCATNATFTVTINPNITPTFSFGTSIVVCSGSSAPALPTTSNNGITGTWSPSAIDNLNSGTYTFTPGAGQCAVTTTLTVTVNPVLTPTFSFGTSMTICNGSNVPALPLTSTNGIAGTWSASGIDNQNSGTYTFTPGAGQCATTTTLTVTVNPNIVPSFSFGTSLTICTGGTVPTLPTTSNNGVTGTWNPSTIDDQHSGLYTFTPSSGQCATLTTFNVTVNPIVPPVFSFGTSLTICAGTTAPKLVNTSNNGILGSWSPATIDNQHSGTYAFTPSGGQCTMGITLTVTVNPNVTPSFTFGNSLTMCQGSSVPTLVTTSSNGITGTWNPSVINDQRSGTYTFTPAAGQCATGATFTVTVNPSIVPTFGFGKTLTICAGSSVPSLPTTSMNGITGSWSPATVDNQTSAVYTFIPDPVPGQCLTNTTLTVTVNPNVTPTFSFGSTLGICAGNTPPVLPTASTNGIVGLWSPTAIDNQHSGTYTFTASAGQCSTPTFTLSVTVTPVPTIQPKEDTSVIDGATIPANYFSGTPTGVNFNWTNSNATIGLPGMGIGNVPSFIATNKSGSTVRATITVVPVFNGCSGTAAKYVITVLPLDKDIFVPNVFSPNGDGKNDILYAYGNYVSKLEMRIFNQWGQQIQVITDIHQGWDGKYKGTPQPVGVYVYTLKAVMTDGRTVQLKGNITLLR